MVVVALRVYNATSTTTVTATYTVAASTTAIITNVLLMRIMPCPHAQPPTLPLTKDEVVLEGPISIHQALNPL